MPAKSQNQPSHLKDLMLLFAFPVGIAIVVAVVIYIPRLLAKPKYDFIYSLCNSYSCDNTYEVNSFGGITEHMDAREYDSSSDRAVLRYYDATTDSTRSLSTAEAGRYRLNTSSKSPDGYVLSGEEGESGFLFWSDHQSGWYLKDGLKKKSVELSAQRSYSSSEIEFLGWVEQ